tara:strand:- start:7737 stop:7889 length:153 start_codon:yes stop_codon:yes gene_type:complete
MKITFRERVGNVETEHILEGTFEEVIAAYIDISEFKSEKWGIENEQASED